MASQGRELHQLRSASSDGPQGHREHAVRSSTPLDAPATPAGGDAEPAPPAAGRRLAADRRARPVAQRRQPRAGGGAAAAVDRAAPSRPRRATAERAPSPTRAEPRMTPRGHRSHQGAADGAPDRAALAADQGGDRVRRDVRRSASSSPSRSTTCWCWPYRAGRRRRELASSSTPRCSNISSRSSSSRCSARAFLSFPVVATQIYMFVAPGLYRHERQAFLPYLVATPVFFVLGSLVVYFLVMPMLVRFSLGMQQTGGDGQAHDRSCCPRSANISR